MQGKLLKLENPQRMAELNPAKTLKRLGLMENQTVCDIGAGSGIFSLPAAKLTANKVYALEISAEMLALIAEKAQAQGIGNIELVKVEGETFALADKSIDLALMVTVLHEIENKTAMLDEIKRILNNYGRLAVIEFHKRETPMGPPVSRRIGQDEAISIVTSAGFRKTDSFQLGDNFYCLVFKTEADI